MTSIPTVYVEIARAQGWGQTMPYGWTDITQYVENPEGIQIDHGRRDELSTADPASCRLTLNNRDGRFTPGKTGGAYYPDIKKGLPIRVTARWPLPTGAAFEGNWHPNPSVETNLDGWANNTAFGAWDTGTVTRDNTRAHDGSWAVLCTGPGGGSTKGVWTGVAIGGLTVGRTYTYSCWVYVPSGDADVQCDVIFYANGTATSVKDTWVRISVTWVAAATTHFVGVLQKPTLGASDQVWIDEALIQEGSTVGTYNTNDPDDYYHHRFTGYVDDWPITWPGGIDVNSEVPITASGSLARVARVAVLQSLITEEILADGPVGYFPLIEDGETGFAGDISGNNIPAMTQQQAGTGGTLVFGENDGGSAVGTDDDTFLRLDRASATNGKYLGPSGVTQVLHQPDWPYNHFTAIEILFRTSTVAAQCFASVHIEGGLERLELIMDATGKVGAYVVLYDWIDTYWTGTPLSAGTYADGEWHHLVAYIEETTTTTVTVKTRVDGGDAASVGTFTRPTAFTGHPIHPRWTRLRIGTDYDTNVRLADADLAHCAVWSKYHDTAMAGDPVTYFDRHADAATTGFNPQTVADRLARYATYVGMDPTRVNVSGTTSVGHARTKDTSPLEVMRAVERTDNGALFDDGDGRLAYVARTARYSATSAFTLDAAAQDIDIDVQPRLDDQFLINEVRARRVGGGEVRAVDTASQSTYGPYVLDLELAGTDDNHVLGAAQWYVSQYAEPEVRIPTVTVDLWPLASAKAEDVLQAEVGTRITVSNLPSQAPATSGDWFIEGWQETLDPTGWRITFNLSPANLADVWLLADTTYGVLGSTTTLGY